MQIGFLVVATGKYTDFVYPLWQSILKHSQFPLENVHLFVCTDKTELFSSPRITPIFQEHRPFPYPTLMRYHFFTKNVEAFADMDYLFYCDADMRFVGDFGEEILGNLVAVLHPGFYNKKRKEFTYERNPVSRAYISYEDGERYYCGGFNGGKRETFLTMARTIASWVDIDAKKNIIAKWHDESHLNRYLLENNPTKILPPAYCYPEHLKLPYTPILLALYKNHEKIRFNPKERLPFWKKIINSISP